MPIFRTSQLFRLLLNGKGPISYSRKCKILRAWSVIHSQLNDKDQSVIDMYTVYTGVHSECTHLTIRSGDHHLTWIGSVIDKSACKHLWYLT